MGDTLEELQKQYDEYKVCQVECYSRIVGYYRNYNQFNDGKLEEAKLRVNFKLTGE